MAANPVYLPIFPLPDLSFFPHTLLPLHIFEARYRAMITDCLARDRRLAVVGLKPGYEATYDAKPPVHGIAGAGSIVRCQRLASGRFNVLLKGEHRVRIEKEVPTDTLYRMVVATPLEDLGGDRPVLRTLAETIRERCLQILEALGRGNSEMRESLEAVRSPAELGDQVASGVIPDATVRRALLEELDVERRLERLTVALDDLLRQLTRGR
ncbi:MAG TPA: LON peptidase substrate-binding domain-containing protein [Candidatus Methylomirabilis sp.]|nr:LON peptidase substrate-binding domain-containing protein [Candidatus Methylomirabilis sp.]